MKVQTVQIAFVVVLLLISLPSSLSSFAQVQTIEEDRIYIKIQVDGLSCPFCAYGLEKKLKEVESAKDIYIDVKEGFVTLSVFKENKPDEASLKKIIKKAGFTARAITFSESPFEK